MFQTEPWCYNEKMKIFGNLSINWQLVLILAVFCGLVFIIIFIFSQSATTGVNAVLGSIETRKLQFATVGWEIYQNKEWGFQISHPADWKMERACYPDLENVDCIKSLDFKGAPSILRGKIESGALVLIFYKKGAEGLSADAILRACLLQKKIYPQEKVCELVKLGNIDAVNLEQGIYVLTSQENQYSLVILDPYQKNTDILALMLKTFEVVE